MPIRTKMYSNGSVCYTVGDVLWVKLQGYPWWPGIVIEPTPKQRLTLKIKRVPILQAVVRFFNDQDRYALISYGNIQLFRKDSVYALHMQYRGNMCRAFKKAIEDAWDHINKSKDETRDYSIIEHSFDDTPDPDINFTISLSGRKRSIAEIQNFPISTVDGRSKREKRIPRSPSAHIRDSGLNDDFLPEKVALKDPAEKLHVASSKAGSIVLSAENKEELIQRGTFNVQKPADLDTNYDYNRLVSDNYSGEAFKEALLKQNQELQIYSRRNAQLVENEQTAIAINDKKIAYN